MGGRGELATGDGWCGLRGRDSGGLGRWRRMAEMAMEGLVIWVCLKGSARWELPCYRRLVCQVAGRLSLS